MKTFGNLSRLPLLLVLLFAATAGCKPSGEQQSEATTKKLVPIKENEWWNDLPREVYGDPKLKKSPRIQFKWDPDKDGKWSIGSVNIDGTDMRMTLHQDFVDPKGENALQDLMRSPNGRYIVFTHELMRKFIDLQTMTMKNIERGGMVPLWTFPDDGHSVLYYIDARLKRYYFLTGKLEKLPMINSSGLHVVRGKPQILAVREKVVEFYDFKANLSRTIDIIGTGSYGPKKTKIRIVNTAPADGNMLYFETWNHRYVVDLNDPKNPVYKKKINTSGSREVFTSQMFDPEGKYLYYRTSVPSNLKDEWNNPLPNYPAIGRMDLKTLEKKIVFVCKTIGHFTALSLYNY